MEQNQQSGNFHNEEVRQNLTLEQINKQNARAAKWDKMLQNWQLFQQRKRKKVKSRIRKGIPSQLRGQIWYDLAQGLEFQNEIPRNLFLQLARQNQTNEFIPIIDRDVQRISQEHIIFQRENGQQNLLDVLKAYSFYDPGIGYCQGMANIVSMLLIYMESYEAFIILVSYMKRYNGQKMFLPEMPLLYEYFYICSRLVQTYFPKLWRHMCANDINVTHFSPQWFLAVFTSGFQLQTSVRVWDCLLFEGNKILFRLFLGVLKLNKKWLKTLDHGDFLEKLREITALLDPEQLIRVSFSISLSRNRIEIYRKEYYDSPRPEFIFWQYQKMDVFLIIITIVITVLLLVANVYFVIYFLEPNEEGFGDSWYCKILVVTFKKIFGLMLAWAQVLALPLDVSNSRGDGSGMDIDVLWQVVYVMVFAMVIFFLPVAMFYQECDPEDTITQKLCYTFKHMIFLVVVFALIFGCMYGLQGKTNIPFKAYSCPISNLEQSNSLLTKTDCDDSDEVLQMWVSFPIYIMALMSFVGWWLLVMFGGIGLSAVPLDFFNLWRFKPVRLSNEEINTKKNILVTRTGQLQDLANEMELLKTSIANEGSYFKRVPMKSQLKRGLNQLVAQTLQLEDDYQTYQLELGATKVNILWYPFYLFMSFITGVCSILWILHIIIYILTQDELGTPAHPFLNNMFIGMEHPGISFIGTTIYSGFVIYLLICCIKGNVKFGLRFFFCCRAHPIKKDNTPMSSMLFNVCLILLCSVSVTLFSANAFSMYARLSDINNMFVVQVRYLVFFSYFYENNVFEIMLLCWSFLAMAYLLCKNRQDFRKKPKYDFQLEKEKFHVKE